MIRTPSFWYRAQSAPAPLAERALDLFAPLYGAIHRLNQSFKTPQKSPVPVICIGNAVAGGSGKTPAALAVMDVLRAIMPGSDPAFLSRGFGGSLSGPVRVNPISHGAAHCGDEPLLLARSAPCIISRDRAAGAKLAQESNYTHLIMDDGLQNNSIEKAISFMVIDGAAGFGNGKTLPAGPLRESLPEAFTKTDAFIIAGHDRRHIKALLPAGKPVFTAHIKPDLSGFPPTTTPLIAFAGLGRPEKFYHLLADLGYSVIGWHSYPDHHAYAPDQIQKLLDEAMQKNAALVTTEKDAVRIADIEIRTKIATLPITMEFDDISALSAFLKKHLP